MHHVGKDAVYAGQNPSDVFKALKVDPDFDYTNPKDDTRLLFVHRKLTGGDLYFVDNRNSRDEAVEATFRVTGKTTELWHAESGKFEPVSFRIVNGSPTIPLHLEPWGSVFVVFRKATAETLYTLPATKETELVTVNGSWKVNFQAGCGVPLSIMLEKLASWTENADAGVKYFSGTGDYTTTLDTKQRRTGSRRVRISGWIWVM